VRWGRRGAGAAGRPGAARHGNAEPAEEPQQSVPGPTPQETSGKTDSQNFTGKENATTPQPSAGSSTAPDKLENGEKRK
jgi:hypothetical protein